MDVVTRLSLFKKPTVRRVVVPDAALPSFYDLKGKAPFTFASFAKSKVKGVVSAVPAGATKPFDHVKGCYAYIKGLNGADMSMFARKNDSD